MRIFKKANLDNNWKCPICGTNEEREIALIGITGTQDGTIMQAEQFHLDCIDLLWDKKRGLLYQITKKCNT